MMAVFQTESSQQDKILLENVTKEDAGFGVRCQTQTVTVLMARMRLPINRYKR